MKAIELVRTRIAYSSTAFAELVLWRVPKSVQGSSHRFKYRLAYVVDEVCVLRYDNEVGKATIATMATLRAATSSPRQTNWSPISRKTF